MRGPQQMNNNHLISSHSTLFCRFFTLRPPLWLQNERALQEGNYNLSLTS